MPVSQRVAIYPAVDPPSQRSAVWCENVTDFQKLQQLWAELQKDVQSDWRADIFQRPAWVRAFWGAYGDSLSIYSPVVYQAGSIIGILPLVRKGDVVEFVGAPDSDYNDLLCNECNAPMVLEIALSSLLRSPAGWESCILDNLPSDSRIVRHLSTLPSRLRSHLQLVFRDLAPTILQDEKRKILDGICSKGQHPCYRKLQKFGSLTFRHLETREEAREHLVLFFDQHITRWAMSGLRSAFLEPETRTLYQTLIEELDPRTELRFAVLELNSQPIAYHLGFQVNGKFTLYKPTFDIRYWDYSPGDILLRSLFEYARGAGVQEFDFSIGDESYKYRYANQVKKNYTLYVERHPAHIKTRLNALVRHGKHIVRQKPATRRVVKRAVRRLNAAISYANRVGLSDLVRWWAETLRTTYRKTIWKCEEAFVFSGSAQPVGDASVEIVPLNLDFLARLSLSYPELLTEKRLRECRARLKNGDLVFLARRRDQESSLLWLGRRSEISLTEILFNLKVPLMAPALVIYEIWTLPHSRPRDVPSQVFSALARRCEDGLWIYCLRRQRTLLRALENAGFQSKYRIQHCALLHWFHHTRITSLDEIPNSHQQQPINRKGVPSCRSSNALQRK